MEEWVDKLWECLRMEYFIAITNGEEKDVAWEKDGLQKLVLGHLKGHMKKKMCIDPNLTPYTKPDSRWSAKLNMEGKQ